MAAKTTAPRTTTSRALAVCPPRELWAPIQAVRSKCDKAYGRWPPHLNLAWPLVDQKTFTARRSEFQSALRKLSPFQLKLAHFSILSSPGHKRKGDPRVYVALTPEKQPPAGLAQLQRAVTATFGDACSERKGIPHLTVAQVKQSEAGARMAGWQAEWTGAVEWRVESVVVLEQNKKGVYAVIDTLEIGSKDTG